MNLQSLCLAWRDSIGSEDGSVQTKIRQKRGANHLFRACSLISHQKNCMKIQISGARLQFSAFVHALQIGIPAPDSCKADAKNGAAETAPSLSNTLEQLIPSQPG